MASSEEHLMVAAIDFGTTYSGYAFSFRHDYKRDPLKVSANSWTAGSGGLISLKTPTCVLFTPEGDFDSFGYEAEDKYSDLVLDEHHFGWHYFRRFKMKLYQNKSLNRGFSLEDDQGGRMTAIKVFSSAIRYLKDHLLDSCKNQLSAIKKSDILWVLTVPAIWSDPSKQFMREAAEEAGIDGRRLMIALEPEAASLYCRYLPMQKKGGSDLQCFTSGSKYLVLDAGGGTIDITVHKVQRDGSLKEIHKANGGDWGGTKVDRAFQILLSGIIGNGAFHTFETKHKIDMIEVFRDFEIKKRTIKPNPKDGEKINFKIPMKMNECCKEENNDQDVAAIIKSRDRYKGVLSVTGDKLRADAKFTLDLFKDPAKSIVEHLRKLLKDPSAVGVKSILMVGGFSESPVLQSIIHDNFPSLRVIVPPEAGLAVLKGAVIFGHEPRTIKTRICKYTYGVECVCDFDPEKHDLRKQIIEHGIETCDDIFSIHVCVGDSVNIGEPQKSQKYDVVTPTQTEVAIPVFVSTERDPMYTTDPGCTKIGVMTIDIPDTSKGMDRGAHLQLTFSHTELEIEATDINSGEQFHAAFDFL